MIEWLRNHVKGVDDDRLVAAAGESVIVGRAL